MGRRGLWALLAVFGGIGAACVLACGGCLFLAALAPKDRTPAAVKPDKPKPPGVTKEGFARIEEGMSYDEVCEVLGGPGREQSSSSGGGIQAKMYLWKGGAFRGAISCMFQDGRLTVKSQAGL
jgi:hypothetical protein